MRRELLAGAGAIGLGSALAVGGTARAQGGAASGTPGVSVAKRGKYATVPLRQESINVTAIQSRVRSVDVKNLGPTMKANLDHVLELIDIAQGSSQDWGGERLWGAKQDLICMHEFPIQGFQPWTRSELNRVAFDLPGPETEAIGARARKYGCYIAFGCYAKEQGWPRHVINMSVIVGPTGDIVARHWKARNVLGLFGENALIGTTVYDVLDRYVEMYGWDAVLPVARTDIGNIAMTSVGAEPMLYTCLAMKGAEIMIRTAGYTAPIRHAWKITNQANAFQNLMVTASVCMCGSDGSFDSMGEGMFVNFDGTPMVEGGGRPDEIVTCEVRPDLVREARRHWGVENNIYQLYHRGYVAVKGGAQDCPYTFMQDMVAGRYRLPWDAEIVE
jgi:predicted amidohydrolase